MDVVTEDYVDVESLTKEVMKALKENAYDPILTLVNRDTFSRFKKVEIYEKIPAFSTPEGFYHTAEAKQKYEQEIADKTKSIEEEVAEAWKDFVLTQISAAGRLKIMLKTKKQKAKFDQEIAIQMPGFIEETRKKKWKEYWRFMMTNPKMSTEKFMDIANYFILDKTTDGYGLLERFMASEFSSENLNWIQHYHTMKTAFDHGHHASIMVLFDVAWCTYIAEDSAQCINIPYGNRKALEDLHGKCFADFLRNINTRTRGLAFANVKTGDDGGDDGGDDSGDDGGDGGGDNVKKDKKDKKKKEKKKDGKGRSKSPTPKSKSKKRDDEEEKSD